MSAETSVLGPCDERSRFGDSLTESEAAEWDEVSMLPPPESRVETREKARRKKLPPEVEVSGVLVGDGSLEDSARDGKDEAAEG